MDHNLRGIKRIITSHNPDDTSRTPKARASPTFEELLQESDSLRWTTPLSTKDHHDHEQDFGHHINIINKKSVLAKMREKARRLKISMSKRRYDVEDAITPPWGVSLHDEDDEDHFGPATNIVPKFELSPRPPQQPQEQQPQQPRMNPNPREITVISDEHELSNNTIKTDVDEGKKEDQEDRKLDIISNTAITLTRSVSKRLAPAINIVSDATSIIASKIGFFAINTVPVSSEGNTRNDEPQTTTSSEHATNDESQTSTTSSEPVLSKGNTPNDEAPVSTSKANTTNAEPQTTTTEEKGVSENVKNYLMQKLEPGEDEKALSEVISEAISPRKVHNEMGIMEKVRGAFTALLYRSDSTSQSSKQISDQNSNSSTANDECK